MENCQTSGNQTVNTNTAQAVENIEKQVEELVKKVLNISLNIEEIKIDVGVNGAKIKQVQTQVKEIINMMHYININETYKIKR